MPLNNINEILNRATPVKDLLKEVRISESYGTIVRQIASSANAFLAKTQH